MPRSIAAGALLGGALVNLPVVYLLVDAPDEAGALAVPILLVAGLCILGAWAAGSLIEGRRADLAVVVGGLTVLEAPLLYAVLPRSAAPVPEPAAAFFAFAALASATAVAALVALSAARRTRRGARSGST